MKIKNTYSDENHTQYRIWKLIVSQAMTVISKSENRNSEYDDDYAREFLFNADKKV